MLASTKILLYLGCFLITLIWTVFDPRDYKERIRNFLSARGLIFLIVEAAVLIFSFYDQFSWSINRVIDNTSQQLGLTLFLAGLIIAIWARLTMKQSWGVPETHNIKRQNELITTGPFKFSRNPIYLGLILIFLGFTLAINSYLVILLPLVIWYFYKASKKEENNLEKHFGKDYLRYKTKVPKFI